MESGWRSLLCNSALLNTESKASAIVLELSSSHVQPRTPHRRTPIGKSTSTVCPLCYPHVDRPQQSRALDLSHNSHLLVGQTHRPRNDANYRKHLLRHKLDARKP